MNKSKSSGMTLIEVIISIAILGILTIVFLNMFTSGYIGVVNAGKRTIVGYDAQKAVEESMTSLSAGYETIEINFSDGPTFIIDGHKIEKEVISGNQSIKITTFIPNP